MKSPRPSAGHRQVLQRLSTDKWQPFAKLNLVVGDKLLDRLAINGWVERRRQGQMLELKLTQAGLEALKAKI